MSPIHTDVIVPDNRWYQTATTWTNNTVTSTVTTTDGSLWITPQMLELVRAKACCPICGDLVEWARYILRSKDQKWVSERCPFCGAMVQIYGDRVRIKPENKKKRRRTLQYSDAERLKRLLTGAYE